MATRDPSDRETIRDLTRRRIESGRRLKLRVAAFALGMLVLTPVWAVTQYLGSGGWPKRLSPKGNPGDWSPWLIWVALAWGFYIALSVLVLHFSRPVSDREIERQLKRLTRRSRAS